MRTIHSFASLALIVPMLSGCGGASSDASPVTVVGTGSAAPLPAATPTPTPTPSPTPVATPTQTATTSEPRKTLTDKQYYGSGQFSAYSSPWCSAIDTNLKIGTDLVDSISFPIATFPNAVDISTSSPDENPNLHGCGVYGYHFVAYGNYDGGAPPTAVVSRQVSTIASFSETFTWHPTAGAAANYNLLNEFYTTTTEGGYSEKAHEIGLFLHASAATLNFAAAGEKIGTWTDGSGRAWTIVRQDKFLMAMPADGRDCLSATIDLRGLLLYLMQNDAISGSEWVNGAAIGVEPVQGASASTIDAWSIALS